MSSKFIVYKHSSGEFAFVKRSEISSFKPVFVNKHQYRIFVTVGKESFPAAEVDSLDAAEVWILDQIKLIESEDGQYRTSAKA